MRAVRGLLLASHLLPTVAVTAFVTALAAAAGLGPSRLVLLAAAFLTGQLSVGWCNDYVDRYRDAATARGDKPVVAGDVGAGAVGAACAAAVVACVPLSLALGVLPGTLHLLAVASAWSYNVLLKPTVASPLPYLVSFGLVPAIVTTALDGTPAPHPAVVAAGGLLGMAAHFANTVRDTEADLATGIRGLPQRAGPAASVRVSAALVALSAATLLASVSGSRRPAAATLLTLGVAVAAACVAASARARAARSALVFQLNIAAAALVVAGVVASGAALTLAP